MPKNKGAGGKNRRKGKGNAGPKELVFKEAEGQEYGQISKSLGNGYMSVMCFTTTGNILKRAHIRGTMRKRVWMAVGDIVLVSTRGYQDSTCDIVLKYTSDEARLLRLRHQIPDNIDINKSDTLPEDNIITFDNVEENENNDASSTKHLVAGQNRNLDLPSSDSEEDVNLDDI